ncbi:TonB-dependent receptor domain-containing protein [Kordiimonas sp.]|uniref:TonB-dependent receptor domain-containing protein n=1 Tax=Kordiimonas sp. TaxID=1970157 RepID=UPI003A920792
MALKLKSTVSAGAMAILLSSSVLAEEFAGLNTYVHFNFATQPLSNALIEFTDLTGLALVFDSRIVDNKRCRNLEGDFTAKVALDLLLDGTGLRAVDVGGDMLAIVPEEMPKEVALASVEADGDTYGTLQSLAVDANAIVDELLVVGTRTSNPPYFKFKPTMSLEGTRIQFSGNINVSDYLFQLPAMLSDVTSANTTLFGTVAGLNMADLRGVGPERTMVLVNGRRFVPTYGGNQSLYGVDLNSIPAGLVERVELVSGGAATSFGGEAVTGVINFKLRDTFDGLSAAVQTGVTGRSDREEIAGSLTYGTKFAEGRGSVVANLAVDYQSGLLMNSRSLTQKPSGFALNGVQTFLGVPGAAFLPGFGGSGLGGQAAIGTVVDSNGKEIELDGYYFFDKHGRNLELFEGREDQLYNYAERQTLVTPLNRVFGTLNAKYEFSSGDRLIFENSVATTNVTTTLAPIPVYYSSGLLVDKDTLITIPLSNPYVPDALRDVLAGIPDVDSLIVQRRFVELGPRHTDIKRQTIRSMLGLQGMLAPEWSYDIYYQFGRSQVREVRSGLLDLTNYQAAVDPDLCGLIDACTVINPFGTGVISPEQKEFLTAPDAVRRLHADQHIVSSAFAGPVDLFTEEPARVSFGVEYRFEGLDDKPDSGLANRPVAGALRYPGSSGSFSVFDAYADVTLPLLADIPAIDELTLTAGWRVSSASTVGSVTNWHLGGLWSPVPGFGIRVSYQEGRRIPNIAELFSAGPNTFGGYADPCAEGADVSDTVKENCATTGLLGVGGKTNISSGFVERLIFGNPNLEEEHSTNFTLGFVYDSESVTSPIAGRFRVGVDLYHMEIDNLIVAAAGDEILKACYESEGLSDRFCGISPVTGEHYIRRERDTGRLYAIETTYINRGRQTLEGMDIDFQYVTTFQESELFGFINELSVVSRYAYNHKVDWEAFKGAGIIHERGTARFPKHRFQVGMSVGIGDWVLDWDARYRSSAISNQAARAALEATNPDAIDAVQIKSVWYHDLAARYRISQKSTIYGGVRNLLDTKPNPVYGGSVGDTFPEYYDVIGRRFYVGVVVDF